MKIHRFLFTIFSPITIFALIAFPLNSPVSAAPRTSSTSTEKVGYDISYPQCKSTLNSSLPKIYYFTIIGINNGNAASENPCLSQQLAWAKSAKGGTTQDKIQLYVNTANPGEVISDITTWPTNDFDSNGQDTSPINPYGACRGTNTTACSWLYGRNRAIYSANIFIKTANTANLSSMNIGDYMWWLDVETMNTWQTSDEDKYIKNIASLEGMIDYFNQQNNGAGHIGLYSTAYQWNEITGWNNVKDARLLNKFNGLPNWRPSGKSLQIAIDNCKVAPLTEGGFISLTQYIIQGLDRNHSCT